MKKYWVLLLAVVMLVSAVFGLVACEMDENKPSDTLSEATLKDMVAYLKSTYGDETTTINYDASYEVVGTVRVGTTIASVKWTVSGSTDITVSALDETTKKYTIVIPEKHDADISYTLKVVIVNSKGEAYKDASGKEYGLTYTCVAPKTSQKAEILKQYNASIIANPEVGKPYKWALYYTPSGKVYYFAGDQDGGAYKLKTSTKLADAADVYLETIEGKEGYALYYMKDSKKVYVEMCEYNGGVSLQAPKTPSVPFNFDENHVLYANITDSLKGFIGGYNDYNNIRGSGYDYLASAPDKQYPARLVKAVDYKYEDVVYKTAAEAIAAAKDLASGEELAGKYTVTGTVTEITEAYSSDYGTLSFKLAINEVAETTVVGFRVKVDATVAENIVVGTTLKMEGTIKKFNNDIEFIAATLSDIVKGSGEQPEVQKLTVADFLKKGTDDTTVYAIEGWIVAVQKVGEAGSFVVADSTGAIFSYKSANVAIGGAVTVYGTRSANNGVPQIATTKVEERTADPFTPTAVELKSEDISKITSTTIATYCGTYYKFTGTTYAKSGSFSVTKLGDKAVLSLFMNSQISTEGIAEGDEVVVYGYVRGIAKTGEIQIQTVTIEKATVVVTPSQKLEAEKTALVAPVATITATGDTNLPTKGTTHTDVTISWELQNGFEGIQVVENVLKVSALPTEQKTVKLVATLSVAGATEPITAQKEFDVTVNPATVSAQAKVDAVMKELEKVPGFADIKAAGNIELAPVKGTAYEEVVITWTLKDAFEGITVENNTINVTKLPETAGTITLVATLTIEGETVQNNTKEYTVNVAAAPVPEDGGTLENPKTVAEALASGIKAGEYSEAVWYVKGYIVGTPSYNASYKNYTVLIADEKGGATTFKIYGLKLDGNAQGIYENDEIVASGYIQHFVSGNNSELELTFIKNTRDCLLEKYTPGKSKITVVANENADIVIEGNLTEVDNGTEITITVTAHTGYQINAVNVNGKPITAEADGTYKVTVGVPTTIEVETAVEGSAVQQSVVKLTFPDDNKANNTVGAYTETWTAKIGSVEWTIKNFNNNNWKNWTYIRCGSSKAASVGTIATSAAMVDAIDKVVVSIDKITAVSVNSIKLIVAKDANYTEDVKTITLEKLQAGDAVFNISEAYANCYIKLEIDCAKGSSNGLVQISAIEYFATK